MAEKDMVDFALLGLVQDLANGARINQDRFVQQKTIEKTAGGLTTVRTQDAKLHVTATVRLFLPI